jgi:sigma-B regulation protein RsbU (phosphoserine phosphatase)
VSGGAQGRSIAKKLLSAFLIVSACGMLTAIVAAELLFQSILGVTNQSNLSIGETAAQSSSEALTSTVLTDTETLAEAKAGIINESLARLAGDVDTLADYISELYAHPADYRELPFEHLRSAPADTLTLQWALSPGMVEQSRFDERDLAEAGVLDETWLLGNLAYVGRALMADEPAISSLYITTESGINIGYDSFVEQKRFVDTIDLRERDWYLGAHQNDGLYISDTYRDSFERGLNITMSLPVKGPDGSFKGVVGADINISDLESIVGEISAGTNGYAVLLKGSRIISAPGLDENNENDLDFFLGSRAVDIIDSVEHASSTAQETELSATEGSAEPQKFFAVWGPVELSGWQLVIMIPEADITAPSAGLHSEITAMTDEAAAVAQDRIVLANIILIAIAVVLVVIAMIISRSISRRITSPIIKLSHDVDEVAAGNLDYRSDVQTGDEIEALSHSFEHMTQQLQAHIRELNQATAEKERISTELNVAADIQASMLPNTFPAFPDSREFDIYATMDSAKMIGGDFYDFFFIDDRRLALVIADVSGKGIPAALFMVIARTLIKSNAQLGLRPGEVFGVVNDLLCENNDANMFVTAFMGYLDLGSGTFSYVNAGHNPTMVSRAGRSFVKLEMEPGFVLGGLPGIVFEERQATLGPGDRLFLYTDGVTEATSPELELFSEQRLLAVLDAEKGVGEPTDTPEQDTSMHGLLMRVRRALDAFAAGSEQADDITMLALELKQLAEGGSTAADSEATTEGRAGPQVDAYVELRVEARDERLPEVLGFVETALRGYGFSESQITKAAVAAEEVFVNIAHYAYGDDSAESDTRQRGLVTAKVSFDVAEGIASMSFEDSGVAFNPLSRPAPDLTLDALERDIGGLGIHMVLTMMDAVEYDYREGHNILTLKLAL